MWGLFPDEFCARLRHSAPLQPDGAKARWSDGAMARKVGQCAPPFLFAALNLAHAHKASKRAHTQAHTASKRAHAMAGSICISACILHGQRIHVRYQCVHAYLRTCIHASSSYLMLTMTECPCIDLGLNQYHEA